MYTTYSNLRSGIKKLPSFFCLLRAVWTREDSNIERNISNAQTKVFERTAFRTILSQKAIIQIMP